MKETKQNIDQHVVEAIETRLHIIDREEERDEDQIRLLEAVLYQDGWRVMEQQTSRDIRQLEIGFEGFDSE